MQQKIINFLASKRCFYAIVGLLIAQATWIALSGRYPMAFDEDFHFGIIRLYAHHLSPFWASQPANADAFGAVSRDPSYLYQYLMSFPYRLISLFTHNQTVQVIILRFINIGLFASSLPLYQRLLLRAKASPALVHGILFGFVLIPIVPLLAGQINYDNLFLPLVAWTLLLALRLSDELRRTKQFNLQLFGGLLILCLLASLVKYAFLPIFAGLLVFLAVFLLRTIPFALLWSDIQRGFGAIAGRTRWILVLGLLISAGLFGERYGINLVRYHEPVPDCGQVLSVDHCSSYGPWIRDYHYAAAKADVSANPIIYTGQWFHGMWLRLFFAVSGPVTNFATRGPLLLPAVGSIVLAVIGLGLAIYRWPTIWKRYDKTLLLLILVVSISYVAALWLDEYREYLHTGVPVAINGRYLLPVLPFFMLLCVLGFKESLKSWRSIRFAVAVAACCCFVAGGGVLTFIVRAEDGWYWQNQPVIDVNHAAQKVLKPAIPGSKNPVQFLF